MQWRFDEEKKKETKSLYSQQAPLLSMCQFIAEHSLNHKSSPGRLGLYTLYKFFSDVPDKGGTSTCTFTVFILQAWALYRCVSELHGLWNVSFQTQVLFMKQEMVHTAAAFAELMLMKIQMNAVISQRILTA